MNSRPDPEPKTANPACRLNRKPSTLNQGRRALLELWPWQGSRALGSRVWGTPIGTLQDPERLSCGTPLLYRPLQVETRVPKDALAPGTGVKGFRGFGLET